jgi:flagellar FliJ protein
VKTQAKSKRLAVVLDLAEREKEQAAQAFEDSRRAHALERQKAEQLAGYYQDYAASFAATQGLRASDLIKQRNFLQQLADAQKQQQMAIRNAAQVLEARRHAWQTAHLKHKNLAELIARYRAQEDAAQDKKEQKMLDEWFQQQSSRP